MCEAHIRSEAAWARVEKVKGSIAATSSKAEGDQLNPDDITSQKVAMILKIGPTLVNVMVQMSLLVGQKSEHGGHYIITIESVRELVEVLDREDFTHPVFKNLPAQTVEQMLNDLPDIKANLAEYESRLNGAPD